MFIKLSYSCDDRKMFCELASTCELAASGFCEQRKSLAYSLRIFVDIFSLLSPLERVLAA